MHDLGPRAATDAALLLPQAGAFPCMWAYLTLFYAGGPDLAVAWSFIAAAQPLAQVWWRWPRLHLRRLGQCRTNPTAFAEGRPLTAADLCAQVVGAPIAAGLLLSGAQLSLTCPHGRATLIPWHLLHCLLHCRPCAGARGQSEGSCVHLHLSINLSTDGLLGLRGWQWLFLLEGLPTVAAGVWVWLALAPSPLEAQYLTQPEREWVHQRIKDNKIRDSGEQTTMDGIRSWKVWAQGFGSGWAGQRLLHLMRVSFFVIRS